MYAQESGSMFFRERPRRRLNKFKEFCEALGGVVEEERIGKFSAGAVCILDKPIDIEIFSQTGDLSSISGLSEHFALRGKKNEISFRGVTQGEITNDLLTNKVFVRGTVKARRISFGISSEKEWLVLTP